MKELICFTPVDVYQHDFLNFTLRFAMTEMTGTIEFE